MIEMVRNLILTRRALFLLCLGVALLVLTVFCLSGFFSFGLSPLYFYFVVLLDVLLLLSISILIWRRLSHLARKRKRYGVLLQQKMGILFALVSIIPTTFIMVLSVVFFSSGVQDWFDMKVQESVKESLLVARSYLEEHKSLMGRDTRLMAQDLSVDWESFKNLQGNKDLLAEYLGQMATRRMLNEALIFDGERAVVAKAALTFALEFEPVSVGALGKADKGEVVILTSKSHDRVRALMRFEADEKFWYLFVGRPIDQRVLTHLENTEKSVGAYRLLERQHIGFQITFIMLFLMTSVVLILLSVWFGMSYAEKLTHPVRTLMRAAARVAGGKLNERVNIGKRNQEFFSLAQSFNSMLTTIQKQQRDLLQAQQALKGHNIFITTTLEGVSSGVVRVAENGNVAYYNSRAYDLLRLARVTVQVHKHVEECLPSIAPLLFEGNFKDGKDVSTEIQMAGRTLRVRVVMEQKALKKLGYIITLDDMSALVQAQKQSAWADVAQRIAHEVRNPLTPIQLCVERLRSKFTDLSDRDREKYMDTIHKQVATVQRLIDDFSSFARWPAPKKQRVDIARVIRQSIVAMHSVYQNVQFQLDSAEPQVYFWADPDQMSQLFNNVLKNACESIVEGGVDVQSVQVTLDVLREEGRIAVDIRDTGTGFPDKIIEGAGQPYVTTRTRGTGLGLAICRKIIEDHSGTMQLSNTAKGARILINFLAELT